MLLQHFKSYLDGNQKFKPLEFPFTKEEAPARRNDTESLVYIKKWKRAKKAILLRNTNKVIQVMFQDQSELILCSGSGVVTFVNSKQEIKQMPLSAQHDQNLETTDKSLFKRLQYAKEILVQMMSVQSMPTSLTLTNQARSVEAIDTVQPAPQTSQACTVATKQPTSVGSNLMTTGVMSSGQDRRYTKSATKNGAMMSPYTAKTAQKGKEVGRVNRMQTLTASKIQSSTNLLQSNAKQASKKQFELPLLSNRSN